MASLVTGSLLLPFVAQERLGISPFEGDSEKEIFARGRRPRGAVLPGG